MKDLTTRISVVERAVGSGRTRPASHRFSELAAWLFSIHADRWRRRALFYERHRDYFPRLSSGRFVDRCRELEASYRGLARVLFTMPPPVRLVPIRVTVSRLK